VSTASLIVHQSRYDLRTFLRDPRARAMTLLVPLVLLVFFGAVFKNQSFTISGTKIPGAYYYLPRTMVLAVSSAALSNMIITLVAERESGALKRRRATPVPPIALIGGDITTSTVSVITTAIVLTVVGWLAFGTHVHGAGFAALLLALVVGAAALCSLAYAITPFLTSVDSAGPMIMITTIVLNLISGLYAPDSIYPAWLRDIALVLPLRPLALALQAAVLPSANDGHTFAWGYLGIVVAWGVVAGVVAVRKFTWAPSGTGG